jgi:ketosteroid isomerase-like protein
MNGFVKTIALLLLIGPLLGMPDHARSAQSPSTTAQQLVDELLATDRAFAAAGADLDTLSALSAMFDEDVVLPLPDGTFARGKAAAVEALRSNPFNLASKAQWTPIRGGISADGQHGFTLGYMDLTGNDGSVRLAKYLTYWVRTAGGWRAGAYKRLIRPEGEVSFDLMAPSLPSRLVSVEQDSSTVAAYRQSLIAAERAFSDEAQRIGIGPAFQRNGRADAVNVGGEASFAVGADNIARFVGDGTATSPVHWGADDALVASSGDLGVTFGVIRPNGPPPEGRPAASAFFTIWKRDSPADPWRYIAE